MHISRDGVVTTDNGTTVGRVVKCGNPNHPTWAAEIRYSLEGELEPLVPAGVFKRRTDAAEAIARAWDAHHDFDEITGPIVFTFNEERINEIARELDAERAERAAPRYPLQPIIG